MTARRHLVKEGSRVVLLAFLVSLLSGFTQEQSLVDKVTWFPEIPRQGDVIHIVVRTGEKEVHVQGRFLNQEFPFFSLHADTGEYHAIGGIDCLQVPGVYELNILAEKGLNGDKVVTTAKIPLRAREFPEERLTLPDQMVVLSPENLKRVEEEQKTFSNLFSRSTSERFWHGPFVLPVEGKMGSSFGLKRIINEHPRSPHTGQDIKAAAGTPVAASNRGRVVLIGDFFFAGKSVCIDHGEGIYTMYFHLSSVRVGNGTLVNKGDILGWVGSTGRAMGPHLHWGVRIRGARVDPLLLVKMTAPLVE